MITNENAKELPWNMPVITGFPQYANVLAITGQLCGAMAAKSLCTTSGQ